MKRKFFRAKLPTVVWNPKTDRALAVFEENQFTTEDMEVAQVLTNMGYPEVSLTADRPPLIPDDPLPEDPGDIPIMGKQVTEAVTLSKIKREGILKAEKEKKAGTTPKKEVSPSDSPEDVLARKRIIKRRERKG